jgi:hypothetical protein
MTTDNKLLICLEKIKQAKIKEEIDKLTIELTNILFHKQMPS